MKDGVTSHRGRKRPIPVGQGDEVVEQTASSGREETAEAYPLRPEPSDPSCFHCPVEGVRAGGAGLARGGWTDLGWAEKRKRGKSAWDGARPDTKKCLLPKVEVIFRKNDQAAQDARASGIPPLMVQRGKRQEGRNMPRSHRQ